MTEPEERKALLSSPGTAMTPKCHPRDRKHLAMTMPELSEAPNTHMQHLKALGGFRRAFLNARADEAGIPMEARPAAWRQPLLRVNHFERVLGHNGTSPDDGTAGTRATVLAIVKSFVGSGILFMPGGFAQAGWMLSTALLLGIAILNAHCIHLLLETCAHTGLYDFGALALHIYGRRGQHLVQSCLVLSQFACVITYLLFIGEVAASAGANTLFSPAQLVGLELVVMGPLGLVRSVNRLELALLAADILILSGLAIVICTLAHTLAEDGVSSSVTPIKWETSGVFVGTVVMSFEGVPLMLPIRNSMAEPHSFPRLFRRTFALIATAFVLLGFGGYLAYGSAVEPVLLSSMPASSMMTAVRASTCVALALGSPLLFIPAARVTEQWLLGDADQVASRPHAVNLLRLCEYVAFAAVALCARDQFQISIALIGGISGAPIAFICPATFHLRTVPQSALGVSTDVFCILLGLAAMVCVTWQALAAFVANGPQR